MQRSIKFRIWNPSGNNMLYDIENVYECLMQQLAYDKAQPTRNQIPYDHRSEGMVWMQFTGLKDKNGKEIYDSDLVVDDSGNIGKIICGITGWLVEFETETMEPNDINEWGKVIGNIYEHPNLLKP